MEDTTRTQTHLNWREIEQQTPEVSSASPSRRIPIGVCAVLFGALGVHKFLLGRTVAGLIMLLTTVLTLGFGGILMAPVGLIEGILYLTKSDEEFERTYVKELRSWF